jgi:ATP-dependent DNA helicase RecG
MDDFEDDLLAGWLASERNASFGRADALDDETLLANRRAIAVDGDGVARPTVAGLLALGRYPQKFFPRANVVFSSYPTSEKGRLSVSGKRFVDSANIDGPIPQMVVDSLRALSRNIRHGAIVKGALREDVPDYPLDAVREAVANALMHRDFSPEGQGEPVMMDLYPDRLEISNPGGLYGSLTVDQLGQRGGTASRNQYLARILEETPYTDVDGERGKVVENRGTGYSIIRNSLADALMEGPVIESGLDHFRIIFRHRSMTEQEGASYSHRNVSDAILGYISARESASAAEVADAAGVSKKTVSKYIGSLIDEGLVEGIGSRNSPKRCYRLVGRK